MKKNIILLLLFHFCVSSYAQEMNYDIFPKWQRDITKEKTTSAKSLTDINPRFKTTWVKKYVSTELTVVCNGEEIKSTGEDHMLSADQLRVMSLADVGSDIKAFVKYYPDNNLTPELKELDFSFKVIPSLEASFPGGLEARKKYLTDNIISKIDSELLDEIRNVKVGFTVNVHGEIVNTAMIIPSEIESVDKLVLEQISAMPTWTTAQNNDGRKFSQDFELYMGGYCNMPVK